MNENNDLQNGSTESASMNGKNETETPQKGTTENSFKKTGVESSEKSAKLTIENERID